MDNDEVEHVLPQYAEHVLQTEDLEEQAFITKVVYQTRVEHKIKHNTPPMMTVNIKIQQMD